jgi:septum site-determining protein MinC
MLPDDKVRLAVEIKGGTVTLPIVRLLSCDLALSTAQLAKQLAKAPEFFRSAPVILDVSALEDQSGLDLPTLVGQLKQMGVIAVGLRGGNEALRRSAASLKLAVLADVPTGRSVALESTESKPLPPSDLRPVAKAQLITQPVRSGQRVYAKGTDLIVLASVGHGAEIMADGHIHVYGTLRGRALAGVRGDTECRIFCRELQAELVSIAGHYRVNEDLDEAVRGRSVQIYLKGTALVIENL